VCELRFADGEVRNTYRSNISNWRGVFLEVGGYEPNTEREEDKQLQAPEAPVENRLLEGYN
jgi:hypothetical protein